MATLNPGRIGGLWRELVTENPMTIEVSRFRRRFLEGGRSRNLNTAVLVLALLAYACLLVVVGNYSEDVAPSVLIFAQTGAFVILAPALMFGAISGEREKRSWDLLMAAPITHAQVIAGKFLAGLAAIGATFVLLLIPTLMTAYTYEIRTYLDGVPLSPPILGSTALINEEIISLTFGVLLVAGTLLFSARCRRSLMSLSVVIVSLFLVFGAVPLMAFSAAYNALGNGFTDLCWFFHPFFAIERIEEIRQTGLVSESYLEVIRPAWFGVPQGLLYLGLAGVFLVWATKTVNFADGDKKFIPRKPDA